MRYAYSVDAIRAAEAEVMAVVGDDALMQVAARGLAVACARRLRRRIGRVGGAQVLIVVGPGNNGGDGLFAGAHLARQGAGVRLWKILPGAHAAGWRAALAAGAREVDLAGALAAIPGVDLVIDAGFGIGGRDGVSGPLAEVAAACRDTDVLAVDLPSGLGTETVRPTEPVFGAGATVTFGAWKPSLLVAPARETAGEVTFVDIGLAPKDPVLAQWEAVDVARVWPFPTSLSDKYSRGVVGVNAGSEDYPGAALLALGGAVYSGAGMVRYLGPESFRDTVIAQFPNVVHGPGRCQAYLCGPGWGVRQDGPDALAAVLASGLPTVIDADALRLVAESEDFPDLRPAAKSSGHLPGPQSAEGPWMGLAADRALRGRLVGPRPTVGQEGDHAAPSASGGLLLTPHAGELARLLDIDREAVERDPLGSVRTAADRFGATVLLKGATQYVASPGETCVHVPVAGPAWTGQAGSGDTLAGICATLLAAGLDAKTAAVAGASVQAITARRHPGPHPPQELARRLPDTIAELEWLL